MMNFVCTGKVLTKPCWCYLTLLVVFTVVFVGGVATTYYFVESGHAYKYNVPTYKGQTVVVPLKPSENLVRSLSLHLNGSDHCISKATVLPCSNLSQPNYNPGLQMNSSQYREFFPRVIYLYLYLLTNSSISFQYNGGIDTSASVWVFSDRESFDRSRKDLPSCSNKKYKDGGHNYCVEMTSENNSATFVAPKNSFYFIRCFSSHESSDPLYCLTNQYLFWTIDLYWYDPMDYVNDTYVNYFNITSKKKTPLTLEGMYSSDQACVLVHRPTTTFECRDENYWSSVVVSDVKLVPLLWLGLLAAIPLILMLVLLSVCVHCVCYWNENRKQRDVYVKLVNKTKGG